MRNVKTLHLIEDVFNLNIQKEAEANVLVYNTWQSMADLISSKYNQAVKKEVSKKDQSFS